MNRREHGFQSVADRVPFIVGAYAAMPSDPASREEFSQLLREADWVDGLEIPYPGELETDLDRLAASLAPGWVTNTITAIPGTMVRLQVNPDFGLASPDADGRAQAVAFAADVRTAILRLADRVGRQSVKYVQLHSAPSRVAQPAALATSLAELLGWDWVGAELVIEHCDRHIVGRTPEKGFLPVDDEIEVAARLGVGVHINWGRSCLEGRDPEGPLRDITEARARGVLRGVVFSGASGADSPYGPAWADAHLPATPDEPSSLMGQLEIAACAEQALRSDLPGSPAAYLGAKISVPPQASPQQRLRMLQTIARAAGARHVEGGSASR